MKIISYNVNGIRSAMSKGLLDWVAAANPDILCLQETKAHQEQVDMSPFHELGYDDFWHSAEKKGYSGVCTLHKKQPDLVVYGCGIDEYDREGRILRTDIGQVTLLNCYFPSGTTGDVRQSVKMRFLEDFMLFADELKKVRPNLVVLGDYNIAHQEIDIHDPKGNKNSSGFLPEEREWMTRWLKAGFVDTFRFCHPDMQEYSWWSFRAGARGNNKGWRIDYIAVSESLCSHIQNAGHHTEAVHSDHCPVMLQLKPI
jgi:exodeoxyribonuclease III